MRPSTLLRLAVAGTRTDLARMVLTAFGATGATLLCMCAATMSALTAYRDAHPSPVMFRGEILEGGWPGTIAHGLLIMVIPFLIFAAQCAQFGAPARDRRIAAVRLAGATPRQAVTIAAAETGIAGLLGSIAALAIYFIGRRLLDHPDDQGARSLPTNILPPWLTIVAICVGLPLLGTLFAAVLMRRVRTSPFGVARRAPSSRPVRPWPPIVALVGIGIFLVPMYARRLVLGVDLESLSLYGGMIIALIGIVLSAGWISSFTGRVTHRYSRSAAGVIAGSRLTADPWGFSRTLGTLLAATAIGGAIAGHYSYTWTYYRLAKLSGGAMEVGSPRGFTMHVFEALSAALVVIVLIAGLSLTVSLVETIVSRRRSYAALVAGGVPRAILARASIRQIMTAAVPSVVLAAVAGYAALREFDAPGGRVSTHTLTGSSVTLPVPIAWTQLGLVVGLALAAIFATACVGLLFLNQSTGVEELRAS